jgi:2-hydroxychromene-2-carboxylate isomerase
MKSAIAFYFDFISPYGYLAATQIERIAAAHERTVDWRPFLLGVTVMKVMGLKPLMQTPLKSDYVRLDKPRMASLLGVPLAAHDMTGVNSVAAARAFYWIKDRDASVAVTFAKRVLHRLWVDGRDITSVETVANEAAHAGTSGESLAEALGTQAVKDRLRDEVDAAIARGVFGSPFFIVDEQPIWGVDRLWMLEHWLEHGHWRNNERGGE